MATTLLIAVAAAIAAGPLPSSAEAATEGESLYKGPRTVPPPPLALHALRLAGRRAATPGAVRQANPLAKAHRQTSAWACARARDVWVGVRVCAGARACVCRSGFCAAHCVHTYGGRRVWYTRMAPYAPAHSKGLALIVGAACCCCVSPDLPLEQQQAATRTTHSSSTRLTIWVRACPSASLLRRLRCRLRWLLAALSA